MATARAIGMRSPPRSPVPSSRAEQTEHSLSAARSRRLHGCHQQAGQGLHHVRPVEHGRLWNRKRHGRWHARDHDAPPKQVPEPDRRRRQLHSPARTSAIAESSPASPTARSPLGIGFHSNLIGPELGFGQVMGWYHDAPVLLIKSSIGNRGLGWDILPPGSPSYQYGGYQYAGYGQSPDKWLIGTTPTPINWYAGKEFDRFFTDESEWAQPDTAATNVVDVLDNWTAEYAGPGKPFAGQDFEIAGFVWWQGDRDRYDHGPRHPLRAEPRQPDQFAAQLLHQPLPRQGRGQRALRARHARPDRCRRHLECGGQGHPRRACSPWTEQPGNTRSLPAM
jgi:hypothetical protein